jgi:hypothetical protein
MVSPMLRSALKTTQRGAIELALVLLVLIGILVGALAVITSLNGSDRVSRASLALSGTTNERLFLASLAGTGTKVLWDRTTIETQMLGFARRLGKLASADPSKYEQVCVSLFQIDGAANDCSGASATEALTLIPNPPDAQNIDETGNNIGGTAEDCWSDQVKEEVLRSFSTTCDPSFPFAVGIAFPKLPRIITAAHRIDANPFGGVVGVGGPALPGGKVQQ